MFDSFGVKKGATRCASRPPMLFFFVFILPCAEDGGEVSARESGEDFVLFVCLGLEDCHGCDVGGDGGCGGDCGVVGEHGGCGGGEYRGDDVCCGEDAVDGADGDDVACVGGVCGVGFFLCGGGFVDDAVDEVVECLVGVHCRSPFCLFSFDNIYIRLFGGCSWCCDCCSYYYHIRVDDIFNVFWNCVYFALMG